MSTSTTEVNIPAPWGHISAKLWGDEKNEAVIVSHGFLNNAGSFDALIPLLPTRFYYICIDLPGHGQSSHFHSSLPLHYLNYLLPYKIVADFFKRDKYVLIGHSFGGQLSIIFAQLYPNYASKVILLDCLYELPLPPNIFFNTVEKSHRMLFETFEKSTSNTSIYTKEEVVKKIMESRPNGEIPRECAENLAKRMIKNVGEDKYTLTYDRRLNALTFSGFSIEYVIGLFEARPVKCPVLILLIPQNNYLELMKPILEHFKSLKFNVQIVDGHHFVHASNPEVVAPLISNFITNNKL